MSVYEREKEEEEVRVNIKVQVKEEEAVEEEMGRREEEFSAEQGEKELLQDRAGGLEEEEGEGEGYRLPTF